MNATNGRSSQRGMSTPQSRQIAAAPSATSEGESANQSTDGVSIIGCAHMTTESMCLRRLSFTRRRSVRGARAVVVSLIAAGQTESASRQATQRDDDPELGRSQVEGRLGAPQARAPCAAPRRSGAACTSRRARSRPRRRPPSPSRCRRRRPGSGTHPRTRTTRNGERDHSGRHEHRGEGRPAASHATEPVESSRSTFVARSSRRAGRASPRSARG